MTAALLSHIFLTMTREDGIIVASSFSFLPSSLYSNHPHGGNGKMVRNHQGHLVVQQKYQTILPASQHRLDPRQWPVVRIYTEYAGRLWNETNSEARQRIARDKAAAAVKQVQQILLIQQQQQQQAIHRNQKVERNANKDDDDMVLLYDDDPQKVQALLQACKDFLDQHENHKKKAIDMDVSSEANMIASSSEGTNTAFVTAVRGKNGEWSFSQQQEGRVEESVVNKRPMSNLVTTTTIISTTSAPQQNDSFKHYETTSAFLVGNEKEGYMHSLAEGAVKGESSCGQPGLTMSSSLSPMTNGSNDDATLKDGKSNDALILQHGMSVSMNGAHGTKDVYTSTTSGTSTAVAVSSQKAALDDSPSSSSNDKKPKKKRTHRSILFGAVMGMAVACWVFSGNYIFTGLFTLMTILGQLEYYRMVINTGVYPARSISVVGACSMFLTALFCPQHHQIILPLFGLWAMVWFLTMKRTATSIPEIATTFSGMFYLGYVPSFWVRIRLIGAGREPTRLAPILGPWLNLLHKQAEGNLPAAALGVIHLPITTGAIFIFWTWLCLAFADVAAYFVGKNLGRTPLGKFAPAAGATSPNKTVEGVIGGCAVSALLGMFGAWVQKWPFWALTGMIHGTLLGLIGLIGDLTASMIKRDAGIKDFGDLIPEHGGILDRVDSFVWSAPYSWLVCHTIIPALKSAFR
ncbi:hypothetical protein ACA910_006754 [Epithemia clementina (nom. ined.)]